MTRPEERLFDSYTEYRAAVLEALGLARSGLRIFDPDLAETGLESMAGVEALQALARTSPHQDAIRILLRDPAYLEREAPRLLHFVGRFGHRVAVRVVAEGSQLGDQAFLVADDRHFLVRFHTDRPRGKFCADDGEAAALAVAQFDTAWLAAQPGPSGAGLGI